MGHTEEPLVLHPNAKSNFDRKAEELVEQLGPISDKPSPGFSSDHPLREAVSAESIDKAFISVFDSEGAEEAVAWLDEAQGEIGLVDEGLKQFDRLSAGLLKTSALKGALSEGFVRRHLLDWLRIRWNGAESEETFTEFLLKRSKKAVKEREIWLPILSLELTSPLELGRVVLKPITKERIDRWWVQAQEQHGGAANVPPQLHRGLLELHGRAQGFAAATFRTSAEPAKAQEKALEHAEAAVGILRAFQPLIRAPYFRSLCKPHGFGEVGGNIDLTMLDGVLEGLEAFLPRDANQRFSLDSDRVAQLWGEGLEQANRLLQSTDRTELEEAILRGLLRYSKSALKGDLSERLLYIVSALESVLLTDPEEITRLLSERMAILLGAGFEERKRIQDNVKKAYGLRSKFVHNQGDLTDASALLDFMQDSFEVFRLLLVNADKYQSKKELVSAIDSYKLRGPRFKGTRPGPVAPSVSHRDRRYEISLVDIG